MIVVIFTLAVSLLIETLDADDAADEWSSDGLSSDASTLGVLSHSLFTLAIFSVTFLAFPLLLYTD